MGNADGKHSAADNMSAQVYDMLDDSQCRGQKAICSMADDLLFFSELTGMLRCMVRLLQAGARLPEEAYGWVSDEEIRVLEKWALFLELM